MLDVQKKQFCSLLTGDLDNPDDEVIVAHGGPPGGPDTDYMGRKGEALSVNLDLKLIADIGLVGCVYIRIFTQFSSYTFHIIFPSTLFCCNSP